MDFLINQWPFLLIGVLLIIIVIVMVLLIRKPKPKTVDVTWVLNLIGKQNITKVEHVQSRVRISVKSLDIVDLDTLKQQTKGIFIKENTLVITFLNNTEEIVKGLRDAL